jgi:hypothetical protein
VLTLGERGKRPALKKMGQMRAGRPNLEGLGPKGSYQQDSRQARGGRDAGGINGINVRALIGTGSFDLTARQTPC